MKRLLLIALILFSLALPAGAASFYMDYANGNDAADGSTFALGGLPTVGPWKTITSGATAARIAPGDVIRIAKSPDPTSLGQTALFTNLSRAVVLQTGAVTANVLVCDGVTGWTSDGGANVVLASDTINYKLGANNGKANNRSSQLQVGAGFTTGLAAHADLGASGIDLSAYRQCSFWFRPSADTLADGNVLLKLCSDQAGTTPVLTCSIPRCYANQWVPLTFDLGSGNLGTIKSVAIYIGTDFGAVNLNFDNILACKAPGNDAVTLQSLISKNSAAQGGTEPWYAIQSINGTSIYIDNHTGQAGNGGRGYTGTTETVTAYKRDTIKTTMVSTGNVATSNDTGTEGNLIEYQGGYNTSSNSQDGETFYDGLNGLGNGLNLSHVYNKFNRLNFYRYNQGLINGSGVDLTGTIVDNIFLGHSTGGNFANSGASARNLTMNNIIAVNCGISNWPWNGSRYVTLRLYGTVSGSNGNGLITNIGCIYDTVISKNNAQCGVNHGGDALIKSLTTADNGSGAVSGPTYVRYAPLIILASSISEGTVYSAGGSGTNSRVCFQNFNGTAGDHRIYTDGGTIFSESSVRHTASGLAWKLSPTSAARCSTYPLEQGIAEIAVNANTQMTVSLWMRRTNTGITGSLVCRGGQIAGVDSDVKTDMTAAADTWEQVTITFTPTAAGVVEIEAWAYGGTTYSVYVDDLSVSQ